MSFSRTGQVVSVTTPKLPQIHFQDVQDKFCANYFQQVEIGDFELTAMQFLLSEIQNGVIKMKRNKLLFVSKE